MKKMIDMENVKSIMQEMLDLCPEDIKKDKNYVFVVSKDWQNLPKIFKGKKIYTSAIIPEETMYLMFNPFFEEND